MIGSLLRTSIKTLRSAVLTAVTVGTALAPLSSALPLALGVSVETGTQEYDLEDLIEQLAAPTAHDRAMAACRISRLRGVDVAAARDALLGLLDDGESVEGELCRDWGNWRGPGREDSSPGREAAIALEQVGAGSIDPLIGVLRDGQPVARRNAALALGLIEDSRALAALADALDDAEEGVRARAAWALGMIEDSDAVAPLSDAFDDPSAEVRAQVAWALGMIEASSAVPALSRGLRDSDPDVREQSAWALGMIESADAVDGLAGALRDADEGVREQAAWALGMIESSAAVPGLVDALADAEADVRKQVAWALGMIEDPAAVDALMDAIEDDDAGVRKQVLWALMMCARNHGDDLDYAALQQALRRALIGGERMP